MPKKTGESSKIVGELKSGPINPLIVERYKYILSEIQSLNENIHRFITLFQTLTTAIVGGGVAFLASWKNFNLTPQIALTIIRSLEGLLTLTTGFIVVSIIIGMVSWYDYRKEETELLDKYIEPGFRKSPRWKNFIRWHETYTIIFMLVFIILVDIFIEQRVVPLF
jgi:hypothetical protein